MKALEGKGMYASVRENEKFFGSLIVTSGMAAMTYILTSLHDFLPSWMSTWLRWCPTSREALEKAECKLLSYLKQPFSLKVVEVPCHEKEGKTHNIQTLSMSVENTQNTPLVMLHGFASGLGLWVLNLDSLSKNRPVYTFDILGFGRSSRPPFSKDAIECENQLTESIEHWREQMGLEKFILLGHSMGGFLAASYALQHPERVSHLILADPWGFPEIDKSARRLALPFYAKVILAVIQPFNPLAGLRAAGPWGPQLVRKMRPDILAKFSPVETEDVSDYIYHCNAQTPSGESAFKCMTLRFGWAKEPMLPRIINLPKEIPISFIYGAQSWVDFASGIAVKEARKDSYVDVKLIDGAGHHVYADQAAKEFNSMVNSICSAADKKVASVKDSASSPLRLQKQTKNLQESIARALDSESSDSPSGVINFS